MYRCSKTRRAKRRARMPMVSPRHQRICERLLTVPNQVNQGDYEFQSTRPQGARPRTRRASRPAPSFNPRARKGRDDSPQGPCAGSGSFNPRARKGRDDIVDGFYQVNERVSIHAPARGATSTTYGGSPLLLVSIHAPARGATAFDLVKNEKAQGKNIIALRPQSIYLEK